MKICTQSNKNGAELIFRFVFCKSFDIAFPACLKTHNHYNVLFSYTKLRIQLKQIHDALLVASEEQKADLEQVAKDLEEIILLTETSLSTTAAQESDASDSQNESNLEEELTALEGVKCKVPFKYEWGGIGYHNAIILGSELNEDGLVYVKAVFMHPTNKKMQPCPYYLEGNCKYSDDKCHYSHGYAVRLDEVQDLSDPDYSQIIEGCMVLAKYKDDLWYKGRVEDIIKGTEFSVKFLHCNDVLLLNLHCVYPLEEQEEDSSSEFSTEEDDDDSQFTSKCLEAYNTGCARGAGVESFGLWEQHTRGIGSRLMAKMGYVHGSGLGKEGEGRIEPVEAMVFPPGRSLDRCMELREEAGSLNMLSVEKRLERQKAKAEIRLRQIANASERKASVFDFINSKLIKNSGPHSKEGWGRNPQG
ncbi:zinc finger CCCH-type with G patch domain-containing protein isoform X3 [Daphnia magna]|uniref:zinc finger CCCH-type with G patch domain-containing protein isoform X3 n=1 Tax=Daphnia magna TaxID=35525 RepID=UPI001E1BC26C|nr:zinc finger CCCH-type with G patch domain-containing protein isoform X3 [Daphnia magna]